MTQEDKELLFKDLCARLPYGVKVQVYYEDIAGSGYFDETVWLIDNDEPFHVNDRWIENIKPYLRPMSSMTEEEKEELLNLLFDKEAKYFYIDEEGLIDGRKFNLFKEGINYPSFCPINILLYTNWLLKHHFDFMGLISKGLAIEVTESNNPYKE